MPPVRRVRRQPLLQRLQAYLNPLDFLLWLSEEFETRDWDTKGTATWAGLGLNFVFLLARANSASSTADEDDVFGDAGGGIGWMKWLARSIVMILTLLSIANGAYTFLRRRHYRLFETSVDVAPSTPSAHRVKVDSSPAASPLRFLTSIIGDNSAQARAYPDPTRDVWELAVWDPLPLCLRLFCLFSPGHVLVYWLFLPITPADPRPSITVVTTIVLEILLSAQLYILQESFSQQSKDTSLIHKEVMNEYDTKFVHPRLYPVVRDVGTQFAGPSEVEDDVETYTPTTIIRRAFKTNPNPNYSKLIDPEETGSVPVRQVFSPVPPYMTPAMIAQSKQNRTPLHNTQAGMRQPQFRPAPTTSTGTGDGGSLGVFSHANSPLKKASSMYDMQSRKLETPRNSMQAARRETIEERQRSMSPTKKLMEIEKENVRRRTSTPAGYGVGHQPGAGHAKDQRVPRGHY